MGHPLRFRDGCLSFCSMNVEDQLLQELEQKAAEVARTDPNFFCEFVMCDEAGKPFKQSPIHRSWQEFISVCEEHGKRPVILAPWGFGKSQQIAIARVLWELGRDPNLRIKLVCNSDLNAKQRVAAIGRYITESREYHMVFPGVAPDRSAFWSAHELFIQRTGRSVDPSVEAKGIMATGVGGRADLIVFDDVVDMRNAIEQPALRDKVKENFANVWMSRLDIGGRAWYIATAWHYDDLTSMLRFSAEKRTRYWVMTQAVSDDLERIRLTIDVETRYEREISERLARAIGEERIVEILGDHLEP